MRRLLLLFLFVCSNTFAAITDGKFGINQIFDVQYYWSGTTLNASNFIAPYNKNFQTVTVTAGQYFQFFESTTNPGTYGLKLMNSNGTQHSIVHDTGDITALGAGAIFYIGSGFFGNVITTATGYNYGASATFTNMDTSVTSTDLNNYTFASSTPLAAGQTAAPASPPPPALCCGGSSAQFNSDTTNTAKVISFVNRTPKDSQVYIDQVGNSNTIEIIQSHTSNNHAKYQSNGSFNDVFIGQSSTNASATNYTDLLVNGNSNNVTITQQSTGGTKGAFVTINNNNNTLLLQQKDSGSHYADVSLSGGNKNVDILQQGSASHMTKIGLTGLPVDLSLSQSGSTQNFYSITFNCATTGGCPKITVTQGQ